MNYFKLLLFTLIAFSSASFAMQEPTEKFLRKKYQAPKELVDLLDVASTQDEVFRKCLKEERVCKCPHNLPCYIKSFNIERIINLEKLRTFLKQENLDEIVVPEKYIWNHRIVAEELIPEQNQENRCNLDGISKRQFAQLALVSKKIGLWDFEGQNPTFGCTNVFLSKDRPGKQFWKKDFKKEPLASNSKKVAIVDTKRIEFQKKSFYSFTFHLGYVFSSHLSCRNNDRERHEFLDDFENNFQELDSNIVYDFHDNFDESRINLHDFHDRFDAFWDKWNHCFKAGKK